MTSNSDGRPDDSPDAPQIKDGPLRRSEEAADRDNPDVGTGEVSEESEESVEKWRRDETE